MADISEFAAESALWVGDQGTLDQDTRILLATLLVGPMLEGKRKRRLWEHLRPFALTLLVKAEYFDQLTAYAAEHHLEENLRFMRVGGALVEDESDLPENSILRLVRVTESPFAAWISDRLKKEYGAVQVEVGRILSEPKTVLECGLIRRDSVLEKADSRRVGDPRSWVLGADIEAKLNALTKEQEALSKEKSRLHAERNKMLEEDIRAEERHNVFSRLPEYDWTMLDTSPILTRIKTLGDTIREEQAASNKLKLLEERRIATEEKLKNAQMRHRFSVEKGTELRIHLNRAQDEIRSIRESRGKAIEELREESLKKLPKVFEKLGRSPSPKTLADDVRIVQEHLRKACDAAKGKASDLSQRIEKTFLRFKNQWPDMATAMTDSLDYAQDYFAILENLIAERLPEFEERFRTLLHRHGLQKLVRLRSSLIDEISVIRERMAEVNESLRLVPYSILSDGSKTYISIEPKDQHHQDFRDLLADIRNVLANSADTADESGQEQRFRTLSRIVDRLRDDQAYRDRVLDVRRHLIFVGKETDEAGRVVQDHQGGGGKSGGQRQKLASACLAAAMRYQLCGSTDAKPPLAAVVFDEAFDKADISFAELMLEMFTRFGFQPILVTPCKCVSTIEPYIGGAFDVFNDDVIHVSGGFAIRYDEDAQRLNWEATEEEQQSEGTDENA